MRNIFQKNLEPETDQNKEAQIMVNKVNKNYKINEYIVYPSHGVGKITDILEQEIAGMKLELYVIYFEEDKMTLRVPTNKVESTGMRAISDTNLIVSLKNLAPLSTRHLCASKRTPKSHRSDLAK